MLTLVIAEAALERVPASICDHPLIIKSARKRGKPPEKMLLDSNFHHTAMQSLRDAPKRGRPDILHIILLCALESVTNRQGNLSTYIHTRNDEIITINPRTRIPRSYNRFCGLMEQLLETGCAANLLHMEKKSLFGFLSNLPGQKIVLDYKGNPLNLQKDVICIVGGFPHGDFENALPYPRMQVIGNPLPAWTVVNELLVRYEFL
ncbi:MAG: 16S rRNA methyltransferase [Theionarchaea archaeon]|nr:16S rRNA methyltransferase [Theionarchaea archaeon]